MYQNWQWQTIAFKVYIIAQTARETIRESLLDTIYSARSKKEFNIGEFVLCVRDGYAWKFRGKYGDQILFVGEQ